MLGYVPWGRGPLSTPQVAPCIVCISERRGGGGVLHVAWECELNESEVGGVREHTEHPLLFLHLPPTKRSCDFVRYRLALSNFEAVGHPDLFCFVFFFFPLMLLSRAAG